MTYNQFREAMHGLAIFSTRDITKLFPHFDSRRLVEWQQKGYLQKLVNKWYIFSDIDIDDSLRYRISNCLYRPSYISLQSALAHYNLIPEEVYTIQNISTKKTIRYETGLGTYDYRNIKPNLFFGYQVERSNNLPLLIAEPEKAILDFFYLTPGIKTMADIEGLRLNSTELINRLDWEKLETYAACFESAVMNKRILLLKKLKTYAHIT
jgi:predicted transcriptional regulator of viral defense system